MRIGIDCRLWLETGVGRYIRNLVKNLQDIDNRNHYSLFVLSKDYESIKEGIKNAKWRLIETDIRWHSIEEQLKFPIILKEENLHLMHFPYFSVPIFYNRPYVVTIHDLIQHHYFSGKSSTLPFFIYYLKRLGYKKVIENAARKARKIIVPLSSVKQDLIKTLHISDNKVEITKEGFDSNIAKGKVSDDFLSLAKDPFFLYVGNAFPHKNLITLTNAFKRLRKIKLICVGHRDNFYKRLEERKYGNVIFLYDLSDIELFYLYSNAIAAVSASLMEGFGLVPLEALGVGSLVVLSDIQAFRETCGNLPVYFNPNDIEDVIQKLESVLALSESEKNELKRKGKEWVNKFSWKKMAEETLKIYESCSPTGSK